MGPSDLPSCPNGVARSLAEEFTAYAASLTVLVRSSLICLGGFRERMWWAHLCERLSCDPSRITLRTMASSLSSVTAASSSSSVCCVRFSFTVQIL